MTVAGVRTKPSRSFLRAFKKLDPQLKKRALAALEKLHEDHRRIGVHLEPIGKKKDIYTARVDRNYRLVLKLREDVDGPFYLITNVLSHKKAYQGR